MSKFGTTPPSIRDFLRYDPDSGQFSWVVSPSSAIAAGSTAGHKHTRGYLRIAFRGRCLSAHRVAWFLMTGEDAPSNIDHKDLDRGNNRWGNLRLATVQQNGANRPSTSRYGKGVTLHRNGKYQAQIKYQDRNIYLGLHPTREEAAAAYMAKATELFGEFARGADA